MIKKKKKATSLVEVLVVMAVISVAVISSISLVAKARITIKNNEIQDESNAVLLKALEAFKSPDGIFISKDIPLTKTGDLPGSGTYTFSLNEQTPNNFYLKYEQQPLVNDVSTIGTISSNTTLNTSVNTTGTTAPTTPNVTNTTGTATNPVGTTSAVLPPVTQQDCNDYFVSGQLSFNYCEQVQISPKIVVTTQSSFYEITVTILYSISGKQYAETVKTYRYDGFKQIP